MLEGQNNGDELLIGNDRELEELQNLSGADLGIDSPEVKSFDKEHQINQI